MKLPSTLTSQDALELFKGLEPVTIEFMIGKWRGEGFPTGHHQDGLLEAYNWRGKHFHSSENVHPLVFNKISGGTVSINPGFMAAGFSSAGKGGKPPSKIVGKIVQYILPIFSTSKSRARLRMIGHEGVSTAAMLYDQLPIIDVFRKLDDNTVLGIMDHKDIEQPFFFKLIREIAR